MSADKKEQVDKAIEKASGSEKVGEAVEKAIDKGPSRERAEEKPASNPPDPSRDKRTGTEGDES